MSKEEKKELFKEQNKSVNKIRLSMWVGILMFLSTVILTIVGILNLIALISLPILVVIIYNQRRLLSIELTIQTFQKYLLDEEFHKEFNEKHNINQQ